MEAYIRTRGKKAFTLPACSLPGSKAVALLALEPTCLWFHLLLRTSGDIQAWGLRTFGLLEFGSYPAVEEFPGLQSVSHSYNLHCMYREYERVRDHYI